MLFTLPPLLKTACKVRQQGKTYNTQQHYSTTELQY